MPPRPPKKPKIVPNEVAAADELSALATDAKPKHPGGRPTSFRPEFVEQARKLAQLGATDREVAGFFEVAESTLYLWKHTNPEFSEALKTGKSYADNRVEQSLYRRAVGYSHDAVKIFMPAGREEPVLVPYQEHVPPDTTAGIFWLKNRRPDEWRDVKVSEITDRRAEHLTDDELADIARGSRARASAQKGTTH